jgi:hypothetical protein
MKKLKIKKMEVIEGGFGYCFFAPFRLVAAGTLAAFEIPGIVACWNS